MAAMFAVCIGSRAILACGWLCWLVIFACEGESFLWLLHFLHLGKLAASLCAQTDDRLLGKRRADPKAAATIADARIVKVKVMDAEMDQRSTIDKRRAGDLSAACTHANMRHVQ